MTLNEMDTSRPVANPIPVKLPWLFPGAPWNFNGAPANIQGNLDRYATTALQQNVRCVRTSWNVL